MSRNLYSQLALKHVYRLLSNLDREQHSLTYGSFDRTFWSWKFTDFQSPRLQEAVYPMCWLYNQKAQWNDYFNNKKLLEWIEAGFSCWINLQNKDGSFDEAYPYERSLAATAFSSFYLFEGFKLVEDKLSRSLQQELLVAFKKASNWLCKNTETHGILSNHLAAAAAFLASINLYLKDDQISRRSNYFIETILENQSSEGWYTEYGGCDIGYQTHCMFYLAHIWKSTQDKVVFESLEKALKFSTHFIHVNGTISGEYMSRNTSFYFPAAFEILSEYNENARSIAAFMRMSVESQLSVGLSMMDVFNHIPMLSNYLFASDNFSNIKLSKSLPFSNNGEIIFPDAGVIVKITDNYRLFLGCPKAG